MSAPSTGQLACVPHVLSRRFDGWSDQSVPPADPALVESYAGWARADGRMPRGRALELAHSAWRARRSYHAEQFSLEELLELKQCTIALVLPTREVAGTIGPIVEQATRLLDIGLLDKALVVDSASSDGTARVAEAAGLAAVQENQLSIELGPTHGRGDAMWRAVKALQSDIVVFLDTATEEIGEHFLTGLVGPLICDPDVQLVKGFFHRPSSAESTPASPGEEQVTELMARPLLNLHAPELAVFEQPLAGETAVRRELLEQVTFDAGDGVEMAMLIDAWRKVGLEGLAQVDLGVCQSHHPPSHELSAMAYAVLLAAEARFLGDDFASAQTRGPILCTDRTALSEPGRAGVGCR